MARSKGSANLAASLEVLAGAPLDAREKVAAKADLTASGSFPYPYIGMEVYVEAENKKYRLVGADPTDIANWQNISSGGGSTSLSDLTDTDINSPEDGDIIQYNEDNQSWDNVPLELNKIKDVAVSSPTAGQVLGYNATTEQFENMDASSESPIVNGYAYTEPFEPTSVMDYINWIRNHTDKTILVPNESIFSGKTVNCLYMVLGPAAAYLLFSEFPFNLKVYYLNRSGTKIFNSTRLSQDGTTIVGFNSNGTFTYANGITQAKQVSIHDEVDCDYLADNDKEAQLFVTPNINLLSNMYKDNTIVIENQLAFYSDSSHTTLITPQTGKFYVDTPTGEMYEWDGSKYKKVGGSEGGTSDYTDLDNKPQINGVTLSGNKSSDDLDLQGKMQFSTMPTAAAAYAGKTVQFTGATAGGYTHNYFYECVEESGSYSWEVASVQSGGGSSGHTIVDSDDTAMTARTNLKFGEGFDVTDDNTNDETVVEPTPLETGDMDSIVYPLPDMPHPNTSCGFTPVGTVISVMGNSAPLHYLACNGQVVNIATYPELADYFEEQFGSKNHFGGNGTTTFAVPDLSGEFLRGTGNNSHQYQGKGMDVGVHQDATTLPNIILNNQNRLYAGPKNSSIGFTACDYVHHLGAGRFYIIASGNDDYEDATVEGANINSSEANSSITTRPTNTSVLYCIATKDIYIDARSDYSTSEKVVGTWIDGKPIYQRTILIDKPNYPTETTKYTSIGASVADVIDIRCMMVGGGYYYASSQYEIGGPILSDPLPSKLNGVRIYAVNSSMVSNPNSIGMTVNNEGYISNSWNYYVTIKYTKTTDTAPNS